MDHLFQGKKGGRRGRKGQTGLGQEGHSGDGTGSGFKSLQKRHQVGMDGARQGRRAYQERLLAFSADKTG